MTIQKIIINLIVIIKHPKEIFRFLHIFFLFWMRYGYQKAFPLLIQAIKSSKGRLHLLEFMKLKLQQSFSPLLINQLEYELHKLAGKKKKIVIGLLEHVGDIVACEPVIRYIRKKNPKAIIAWAVDQKYRELIDSHPDIDHTIALICLTDWIKLKAHLIFDEYIDLHVNHRICQACMIPLIKTHGDQTITGDTHLLHGSILEAFCQGAGLPKLNESPRIYISEIIKSRIDKWCLPKKFIVLNTSSNMPEKDWPKSKWIKLAKYLTTHGYDVIELGVIPVIRKLNPHYFNFCGKTTLLEAAEIIRRSSLFIGVDSGLAHFANALDKESVILIGKFHTFDQYNPYSGNFAIEKGVTFVRYTEGHAHDIHFDAALHQIKVVLSKISKAKIESNLTLTKNISSDINPKFIAFYLPQFHPIAENDKAWGKGFTEWTNVVKTKPFYKDQYQPRIPKDLGFYDLGNPDVLLKQTELAKAYGINAFCYYYYWFNGKKVLHKPIDRMLQNKDVDMPFCFCWANENWTKKWDGKDNEIILEQKHNHRDDLNFIQNLIHIFEDRRYIKVNGKPLLLIYRVDLFPNIIKSTQIWRAEAKKAGFKDLYLVCAETTPHPPNPEMIGFDASYEIPTYILPPGLSKRSLNKLKVSKDFHGRVVDYNKVVNFYCKRPDAPYKRYRSLQLAWDNSARHGNRALIFDSVSPKLYEKWLRDCCKNVKKIFKGEERLVFINAWNEWAEGSYLEPDLKNGCSYLEATLRIKNENIFLGE